MTMRKGEESKTRFRGERFFQEGGKWYITTREGKLLGPTLTRADAEQELMMYLRDLEQRSNFGLKS